MVENIETQSTICIDIDDVNKGIKKMANEKATDTTSVIIIEQAIKQGFPNYWIMNWIKPIFKAGDKNQV